MTISQCVNLATVESATKNVDYIVGSDEAGYGCWAGPLTVCAVAVPKKWFDRNVKDSKELSRQKREDIYERYFFSTLACTISRSSEDIDRDGVWKTLLEAHRKAIEAITSSLAGSYLTIIDGTLPVILEGIQAYSLSRADRNIQAVSLASIFAKVTRDRMMVEFSKQYPGYGFEKHCGYGTADHGEALNRLGPCPIHRKSYKPISAIQEHAQNIKT